MQTPTKRTEVVSLAPHTVNPPVELGEFSIKCGKIKFKTERRAIEALQAIEVECAGKSKRPVDYYRCARCKGFHLTSQKLTEGEKRARDVAQRKAVKKNR